MNDFKTALLDHIVRVTFTKSDGSVRTMRATQSDRYVQRTIVTEEKKPRKQNENITHLYDVDIKAWRSMRTENLITWEIEE